MTIHWFESKRGVVNKKVSSGVRVVMTGKVKKEIEVRITKEVMKRSGIQIGDSVKIGFDDKNMYALRVASGGYIVSPVKNMPGLADQQKGKYEDGKVRVNSSGYTVPEQISFVEEMDFDDPSFSFVMPLKFNEAIKQ